MRVLNNWERTDNQLQKLNSERAESFETDISPSTIVGVGLQQSFVTDRTLYERVVRTRAYGVPTVSKLRSNVISERAELISERSQFNSLRSHLWFLVAIKIFVT